MPTATITYQGDLRTVATHIASGKSIVTDAPIDNHGKGEAFSPSDLLCTSLGCCILTIMGIAARTHHINMEGTTAAVTKTMSSDAPRRVVKIAVTIQMPSDKTYAAKEKKILENAAKACPVGNSIHPDIDEVVQFIWA
ncbi:MAG: OsmC family protein [Saprospiraceae bacterium]|nr:OsmC family protein [Saprospiraceae bacterium]MBP7679767.1 OsmC family protein [Saprospiraceae bacterium]